MTVEKYVEQTYPVKCKGRNADGNSALKKPVRVEVKIYKSPGSNSISSEVKCPYNTGGHGQRCKASHPNVDKAEKDVFCPYSFDIRAIGINE